MGTENEFRVSGCEFRVASFGLKELLEDFGSGNAECGMRKKRSRNAKVVKKEFGLKCLHGQVASYALAMNGRSGIY